MKRLLIYVWPIIPCTVLCLLFLSTDSDISGLTVIISSPALMISALVWALPVILGVYIALSAYLKAGYRRFLLVSIPMAGLLGFCIAVLGSTATTRIGFLWSIIGTGLIFLFVFSVSILPAGILTVRSDTIS